MHRIETALVTEPVSSLSMSMLKKEQRVIGKVESKNRSCSEYSEETSEKRMQEGKTERRASLDVCCKSRE